jgi:YceI-like domain
MGIIKDERDCLIRVLHRYQATGTADALIAQATGGWATLRPGLSPMSSSAPPVHYLSSTGEEGHTAPKPPASADRTGSTNGNDRDRDRDRAHVPTRFRLVPDRSVILIDVRSSVGAISFGALGVTGWVEANVTNGSVRAGGAPSAHLEIAVDGLRSGNGLYDAELLRRIDARRFPIATIDLTSCTVLGSTNRYHLAGDLTFHGITQPTEGTVTVDARVAHRLVVDGEQAFDIRDFDLDSPTVLMLRIYPDVKVRLHIEAEPEPEPQA